MPASTMSIFSEASHFEQALQSAGRIHVIVTGNSGFSARLTQVELLRLRVWDIDERAPQITFLTIPPDVLLALFSIGDYPSPFWSGRSLAKGEILTCGPGDRLHMRTAGPSRWGAVSLPAEEFKSYFNRLTGEGLSVHSLARRYYTSVAGCRRFTRLYTAALHAAERRPRWIVDLEAAHGMEQQLIHALIKCLSARTGEGAEDNTCQDLVSDLEDALTKEADVHAGQAALRADLAVSDERLRRCCEKILGVGPADYVQLYRADKARGHSNYSQ